MSAKALPKDLLPRAPRNRYIFITETRGTTHLLTGICFSKCHGEMWDPAVSQFAHTWRLLVLQLWDSVGRGPMFLHTLHWKGF